MKLYDYIEGRGYWQFNLPLVQIIKSECTMSIWLWQMHIFLDWYRDRPKDAPLIHVSFNDD